MNILRIALHKNKPYYNVMVTLIDVDYIRNCIIIYDHINDVDLVIPQNKIVEYYMTDVYDENILGYYKQLMKKDVISLSDYKKIVEKGE